MTGRQTLIVALVGYLAIGVAAFNAGRAMGHLETLDAIEAIVVKIKESI